MNILVLGDYIEDVYTFGTASRLCPEAPVPVIVPEHTESRAGGSGLVHQQLREFGCCVHARPGSKSSKQRYYAGSHLVCRIDFDSIGVGFARADPCLIEDTDVFVVSDYGKGAMTLEFAREIVGTGKPCFVDAKPHWQWYAGPNVTIFPNHHEAKPVTSVPSGNFDSFEYGRVVSKMGKDGARLNDKEHKDFRVPATANEIVDVCGAGDVLMASYVYAWTLQLPATDCLIFANAMAGESCRHLGTYVVTKEFANQWIATNVTAKRTDNALRSEVESGDVNTKTASDLPMHFRRLSAEESII